MIAPETQRKIRALLQDLESVRENLLALSDDIWLGIDHNNNDAMQQAIEFKREYNVKMESFAQVAEDISVMVMQFTNVRSAEEATESTATSREARDRVIAELDRRTPHHLDEDFTYKRPYAYRLQDHAVTGTTTWRALYEDVLRHLRMVDMEVFRSLPDREEQISRRGSPHFARSPDALRVAAHLEEDIYIEINMSAKMIVTMIQTVLPLFGLKESDMKVYLREDRDA